MEFILNKQKTISDSLTYAESIFNSLLSQAFTGELTTEWESTNVDWIAERHRFHNQFPQMAILALILENNIRIGTNSEILITALMKYAFLMQMEGELHRTFYRFVPYHYGPCAMELYDDLKALSNDGLVIIEKDTDEDKTRIKLTNPEIVAAVLEKEAHKDDSILASLEGNGEATDTEFDPVMLRLLRRRSEIIETLKSDAATILDKYGDLDHKSLLEIVYAKYPAYAKKSRVRKGNAETTRRRKTKHG